MTMRLAHRILTARNFSIGKGVPKTQSNDEQLTVQIGKTLSALRRRPILILDNVADYWGSNGRAAWAYADIPNWAPPFSEFFVEWNFPRRRSIGDGRFQQVVCDQAGAWVRVVEMTDDLRQHPEQLLQLAEAHGGMMLPPLTSSETGGWRDTLITAAGSARFLHLLDFWTARLNAPSFGMPAWIGVTGGVLVDGNGKYLKVFFRGPTTCAAEDRGIVDQLSADMSSIMAIYGLGLAFLHCKNVKSLCESIPTPERGRKKGDPRPPQLKFYTLDISPMKEVLRSEGRSETEGIGRALHICRGHFAHYSEEKPLFGRLAGTFWIPDHVRGKLEHGQVVKNYAVSPGKDA